MKINLTCQVCSRQYAVQPYRAKTSKHCSRICHNSSAGKKGGKAGIGVSRNKGAKHPYLAEYNRTHPLKSERHPHWKGETVGYYALHTWVKRNFGAAVECEECASTRNVEWSNTDRKYTRDRDTWRTLCASCHRIYDIRSVWESPFPFLKDNRSIRSTTG